MRGRFITFEGIDGSGKSTVAKKVFKRLEKDSIDAILTREPTQTWLGDAVRRSTALDGSPFTDLFLFMADRAEHTGAINGWLSEGKTVICDRYWDSTLAYQGVTLQPFLDEDAIGWLMDIHRNIVTRPDITFLLKIDPEESLRRISKRGKKVKFERLEFLRKVEDNYLKIANTSKRYVVVDARLPVDDVTARILAHMRKPRMSQKRGHAKF